MNTDRILESLRQALERTPGDGFLWLSYAQLLEAAERWNDALAAVERAVGLSESTAEASRRRVALLRQVGRLDEALIRCEALLQKGPDGELEAELARIEALRGGPGAVAGTGQPAGAPGAAAAPRSAHSPAPAPSAPNPAPAGDGQVHPSSPGSRPAGAGPGSGAAPSGPRQGPGSGGRGPGDPHPPEPVPAGPGSDAVSDSAWADQFDWGELRVRLADVIGLAEAKRQIELKILLPYQQPEVFQAFGRKAGGGILLYGPPGCGKTYLARATAGELGARFLAVAIHDVLDKYWGESEKAIHAIFQEARRKTPAVLFFDEFDALGTSRTRGESGFLKLLVDQILAELDGTSGRTEGLLVIGATNLPWEVDPAFRRPGRFDRVLFIPPPDEVARKDFLQRRLAKLPGGEQLLASARFPWKQILSQTSGASGADLDHVCQNAAELAIERSLQAGKVSQLEQADLEKALAQFRPSTAEWFASATNHARYSNEGGRYDELVAYLKASRRW
jgi:AAA+ superfamily predicted ATPase